MADAASNTGAKAVLDQLKTLWGKQSQGRRSLAILAIVGVIGVVGVTRFMNRESAWSIVGDGMSPDDASELLSTLQAKGLSARLSGGKVEVKEDEAEEARAAAAAAGLPRGGKGYELFDGASLGQSSFAEQVNFKRALQTELARSVKSMAQVQSARVHLALGKRSVFKDKDERASASVALHLHPGQTLTGDQVKGVRKMVANAVDGMVEDAVVVVDNHGNLLDGSGSDGGASQQTIEQAITLRVRNQLERIVGAGNVSVITNAVVDDREVNETSEIYDPNPVTRSETRNITSPDVGAANAVIDSSGIAGTRGNLPGSTAGGAGGGSGAAPSGTMQYTRNYEVSKTIKQTRKSAPDIQRLYVAIVVNEKTDKDGKPVARTADEMAILTALARNGAGLDDKRGDQLEIRSVAFAPVAEEPPMLAKSKLPLPLPMLIGIGAGALVLLALLFFTLKRGKKTKELQAPLKMNLAFPAPVADLERVLDARDASGNIPTIALAEPPPPPQLPAALLRDRVITTVRSDVDRTAEVLTAWLSEPPPVSSAAAAKGAKS